jgi:hypothetical protein
MKKMILAILVTGCVAFAQAQFAVELQTVSTEQITTNDYKEVALTDLSEVVQEAVKNLAGETFEVNKLEFNAEKELTRVTLLNKEDKSEKRVILDKEGQEVTEN